MLKNVELVLGGARSGKSHYAEQQAAASCMEVVYIATATVYDEEMQQRVERHQHDRPENWVTVEAPENLAAVLKAHAAESRCLLVDCLTLWVTNELMSDTDEIRTEQFRERKQLLMEALPELPGKVIFVSNEVGQGIVPMGKLSRVFVDESGWLHQELAAQASAVTLVVAGIPVPVKRDSE